MSASTHRVLPGQPGDQRGQPGDQRGQPGDQRGGPERLRWLIRRTATGDRDTFSELVDRCSDRVSALLHAQLSDEHRIAGVLAGTFVEVWWLAGRHLAPDTDVLAWIDQIVARRIMDSRPAPAGADTSALAGALWAHSVQVQLAGLLNGRTRQQGLPYEHRFG